MELINGRTLAKIILAQLKEQILALPRQPTLAVLLVGDDPASHLYVNLKQKRAKEIGIQTLVKHLPTNTNKQVVLSTIEQWNNDNNIHGIIVQLPLPSHLNEDMIMAEIDPKKDVDGFHPENLKKLYANDPRAFIPPVHAAIFELLKSTGVGLQDKSAVIIGNSNTFTQPLKFLLENNGIYSSIEIFSVTSYQLPVTSYDILITACGIPYWLNAGMVKNDAIIIDVGTTRLSSGSIVGDVDQNSFKQKTGWITPVPGGVGPITIAMLLKNVITASMKTTHSTQVV